MNFRQNGNKSTETSFLGMKTTWPIVMPLFFDRGHANFLHLHYDKNLAIALTN